MSDMTLLQGRLKGEHLNGIRFSAISTLHVPTAQVLGDIAILEAHPFQLSPANIFEFIKRMCTETAWFRGTTRWGDGMLSVDLFGLDLTIPQVQGNTADKMSFRLTSIFNEGPDTLLRAELEYTSPAFYMFQFAELPIALSGRKISIDEGVATTVIAGGADLFGHVADRYSLPLRETNVTLNDATAVADSIKNREDAPRKMTHEEGSFIFESESQGRGYRYHEPPKDNVPQLSVKFSPDNTHSSTLHGHGLEGPSIAIDQNMGLSASGTKDNVEPIITDLVHAAATMCPTLPMARGV